MRAGTRQGFTLIEVLFVTAIIGIVAAISMPGLTRAKISANEASAIGSLRSLIGGQQVFASTCGGGLYSTSLQNLGLPVAGSPGFIAPDLSALAPVHKSGYEFDLSTSNPSAVLSCNGGATGVTYHATADPLIGSGRRYFGTNGNGTIYQSEATLFGIMPDEQPPPAPATPLER